MIYPLNTQLSQFFNLSEFVRSREAFKRQINNFPQEDYIVANLRALSVNVLDPLRKAIGQAIYVTSGYRSVELNQLVGGAKSSQHLMGEAADIVPLGGNIEAIFEILPLLNLPFDQVIFENRISGKGDIVRWFHISHKRNGPQRGEIFTKVISNHPAHSTTKSIYQGLFMPDLGAVTNTNISGVTGIEEAVI